VLLFEEIFFIKSGPRAGPARRNFSARALTAARTFFAGRPVNITEEILLTIERKKLKVMLSAFPSVLIMSFSWGYTPTYVVVEKLDTGRNLLS
jgi:hypothetical protein